MTDLELASGLDVGDDKLVFQNSSGPFSCLLRCFYHQTLNQNCFGWQTIEEEAMCWLQVSPDFSNKTGEGRC